MPDLPSGTVTFLFTDIEGSTNLWERDRFGVALELGRRLALLSPEERPAVEDLLGDSRGAVHPFALTGPLQ